MHGLDTLKARNAHATIKSVLARAADRGVKLSRAEVLEEMKYSEDEDTTVWSATVDRLMGVSP
jgi:hypothetical protein